MSVELYQGNILDLDVDVIVNAANTELQHAGSLAAAIASEGGPTIQEESNSLGWCDLGSAVVTGAGRLRAQHVVHVPTVDYTTNSRATLVDIANGTLAALQVARGLSANSIAFPLLGAGVVGLKPGNVARAMMGVLADVDDLRVVLCVHRQGDWPSVEAAFGSTQTASPWSPRASS